jgi:hypothetical protein
MPINRTLYDQNVEFGCEAAENQQHEEELV